MTTEEELRAKLRQRFIGGIAERYRRVDYGSWRIEDDEAPYLDALVGWLFGLFDEAGLGEVASSMLDRYFLEDPNGWRKHRSLRPLAEYPAEWANLASMRRGPPKPRPPLCDAPEPEPDPQAAREAMELLQTRLKL